MTYNAWQISDWDIKAGLFDTAGFSPIDAPVKVVQLDSRNPWWYFNSFSDLPDGQYYVGAFLDLNHNDAYNPSTEPAGFYGGVSSPTPLDVVNGNDFLGIEIPLSLPGPGITATSVPWPVSRPNEKFLRMCETVREAASIK
ncbi:MAG: hypothetical protein SGI90_09440 [Candidatus Eisenbacteria bacterium]|nr:hypothetical protein [Candidatus Eisenbacteria bacterium]